MRSSEDSKKILPEYFFIGLFTLAVFLIRFSLWMSSKSIWGDEWYSIATSQKTFFEIIRSEISTSHPPTYQFLLSLWTKLFGVNELSFRSLSHAMNILVILGSYGVAKELFDRKVALLTAALIGICPYFLHLSNEIRSYSTLAFFSTFAAYFFFKARNNPARRLWKFAYALFAVLTIYTEHYGWFWLLGISSYLLFKLIEDWKREKKWVWVQGSIVLFALPSILLIIYQALFDEKILSASKLASYRSLLDMLKKTFGIFWHYICGPIYSMLPIQRVVELAKHSFAFWISFILTLVMLSLCLKALADLFRKEKSILVLSLSTIFFPVFFLLCVYPIRLDARYLCWAVPIFFSLIAYAMTRLKNGRLQKLVVGFFVIYSLIADIYMIRIPTDPMHKEDYRGMLQYSFEHSGKNDAIAGVGNQTTYYLTRIGIKPEGTYFNSLQEALDAMTSTRFAQVWTLHYINMKPEITEQILAEIDAQLLPFHYARKGDLMRFGGPDALTAIQLYKYSGPEKRGASEFA